VHGIFSVDSNEGELRPPFKPPAYKLPCGAYFCTLNLNKYNFYILSDRHGLPGRAKREPQCDRYPPKGGGGGKEKEKNIIFLFYLMNSTSTPTSTNNPGRINLDIIEYTPEEHVTILKWSETVLYTADITEEMVRVGLPETSLIHTRYIYIPRSGPEPVFPMPTLHQLTGPFHCMAYNKYIDDFGTLRTRTKCGSYILRYTCTYLSLSDDNLCVMQIPADFVTDKDYIVVLLSDTLEITHLLRSANVGVELPSWCKHVLCKRDLPYVLK
jgi:hypothetical protein